MFNRILNIHWVLYMAGFWIFQDSEYAIFKNMCYVLDVTGF